MPKLKWDQTGERYYETGVDHGVLFLLKDGAYPAGVAWNGLTNVSENPSGGDDNGMYADNIKYLNLKSNEEYGATIECYTYPEEWKECDGALEVAKGVTYGQQSRSMFGFSYRTKIGNDTEGDTYGYKLHLVYGLSASPSEKSYETTNENPDAITFSYEVTSTPVAVSGTASNGKAFKPVSSIEIDSTQVDADKLAALEDILYGSDAGETGTTARLPLPDEVAQIFAEG